jgi:purine-binding chemotaxis protein CheW
MSEGTSVNRYVSRSIVMQLRKEFALDISERREVLDINRIMKVPQTPDSIRGVINLSGAVVPVVGLNKKSGIKDMENTVNTWVSFASTDQDTGVSHFSRIDGNDKTSVISFPL